MNRSELSSRVSATASLPKSASASAVGAMFEAIAEALAQGEIVTIAGFGAFSTRSRPARTDRNPATRKTIAIPASRAPAFKAGKTLRDAVNGNRPK